MSGPDEFYDRDDVREPYLRHRQQPDNPQAHIDTQPRGLSGA